MAMNEFLVMLFAFGFDGEWPSELVLGFLIAILTFMFSVKVYHDRKEKNKNKK